MTRLLLTLLALAALLGAYCQTPPVPPGTGGTGGYGDTPIITGGTPGTGGSVTGGAGTGTGGDAVPAARCEFVEVRGMPRRLGRTVDARIIHGTVAPPEFAPWMASVQSYRGDHYCTSEVLSPTWVLTAGHCLPPYSGDRVKAGTHDLSQPGQVRTIKRALRHELYNDWSEGSDLALLELDAPLVGITPVKLSSERPIIGAVAIAAGWGRTCSTCPTSTKLLLAETKLISNLECSLSYPGSIQVSMVCGTAPGRDAAPGDSGGFFGQILAGELQQVGVVSWGRACEAADPGEDPTQPCVGVYARLEGTVGGIEACIK